MRKDLYRNLIYIISLLIFVLSLNIFCDFTNTYVAFSSGTEPIISNVIKPNVKSEVYLTYNDYSDSLIYKTNIKIVIKTDGDVIEIPTDNLGGYEPTLFLGDFLGNGLNQIMLTVSSGGSGGYSFVYVYSVENEVVKEIFNYQKFNEEFKFTAKYITPDILEVKGNETMLIDVSDKEKSEMETYVSEFNTAFPYFNTFTNKYYLMTFNKVIGGYSANNYGYVTSLIELNINNYYCLVSQGILGNFNGNC